MTATNALHTLEAEDFASASLRFANGALLVSVTRYPGDSETLTRNGTDGSAILSADHSTLHIHGQDPETLGQSGGYGCGADQMAFSYTWHQAVIEDFAAALQTQHAPALPSHSALKADALIDAIQEASRGGTTVEVRNYQTHPYGEACKDVLSDKPGCLNRADLAALRKTQSETGQIWSTDFSERFEVPLVTAAAELKTSGR